MLERIQQIEDALDEEPLELQTTNSPDSARSGAGLAYAPFLTINDIIALRGAGMRDLEDIEQRILEVPEPAWTHVLDLVRARVLDVTPGTIKAPGTNGRGQDTGQCLALTKQGSRCQNHAREGSSYCASHKGYQPTQAELEARRRGLLDTV